MLWLVETFGESYSAGLVGLLVGLTFGIAAQRSQFCLRASVVEFARRQLGPRMAVWLLTLSTAIVWTQAADLAGIINSADARIMAISRILFRRDRRQRNLWRRHDLDQRMLGPPVGAGGQRQSQIGS